MRSHSILRGALALAAFCAAGASASADELLLGSPNTAVLTGNPFSSAFTVVGACGGAVASLALDGQVAWIGDESGIVYRRELQLGDQSYAFNAPNSALGLGMHAGDLLSAGGSTVVRIDTATGAVLQTHQLPVPVSCMTVVGDDVYVGSDWGVSFKGHAIQGDFQFFGTCGGPVNSIAVDDTHMFLGSTDGFLYRVELASQQIDGFFHVGGDMTAMALHGADVLVGGSDSRVTRVHRASGAIKGAFDALFPVGALIVLPSAEVGAPYCYASACPCGNDGGDGGCLNSTGFGARLTGSGSTSVSADDLRIDAFQLPVGRAARFYMARMLTQQPFGDGLLCAGSGGYGMFRFPPSDTGAAGAVALEAGLAAFAAANLPPAAALLPGDTWNFQVWFRDGAGPCGSGINTSNALSVVFTP